MVAAAVAYLYELYPSYSMSELKKLLIQKGLFSFPLIIYGRNGIILDFKKIYNN
jgi:hypothetical protein